MAHRVNKFDTLKEGRPCYDCGNDFPPEAKDWDHLPGVEKCFNISHRIRSTGEGSNEEIFNEIRKCQLVCACCHRIRGQKRRDAQLTASTSAPLIS